MRCARTAALVLVTFQGALSGQEVPRGPALLDPITVHSTRPIRSDTAQLIVVRHLGGVGASPEEALFRVRAFLRMPRTGDLVVSDASGIRRFDRSGRVHQVAQAGPGPAEVEGVADLAVGQDGRLYVLDHAKRRLSWFVDDSLAGGFRIPDGIRTWGLNTLEVLDGGRLVVDLAPDYPIDGGGVRFPRPIYVALSRGGLVLDTIWAPARFGEACPQLSSGHWRAGSSEDLRRPYVPKVMWDLGQNGDLAIGCSRTYALELLRPDGKPVRISRDYAPIDVSRAEARAFVEQQTAARRLSRGGWQWRGPSRLRERPAYEEIMLARDGRVWVRPSHRRREVETSPQQRAFGLPRAIWIDPPEGVLDVFAADGAFLGTVSVPSSVRYYPIPHRPTLTAVGDTLWAVTRDEYDVESITQFRIVWPPDG